MHDGTAIGGNVAVIYDGFPHYRKGIIEELAKSTCLNYYFFCDSKYRDSSIGLYEFRQEHRVVPIKGFSLGPLYFQKGILSNIFKHRITHCIFLGNPQFVACWMLVPMLRLMGKKVYFWTHGWLTERESPAKRIVKNLFFSLPGELFLYGKRAKQIGATQGVAQSRMHVINNSLDYEHQKRVFANLDGVSQLELRHELGLPLQERILICTARITKKCRFDVLLEAASLLKTKGLNFFLLIVGDGPERGNLSAMAASLQLGCRFWGACYDETMIAKLYKASDLTVSPGKVGLTAIHSMAYGTPVVSHGNFDHQMPEHEAIVPGETGDFFLEDSGEDLAAVIEKWFHKHPTKPEIACVQRVESEFTPGFQARVIEDALLKRR